ncbi:MAG TPA: hypothetical protein VG125_06665 [Pirellulales bacterium]|jgi:hypothetical protein|nr:hypothetical protein [Pirellulales bacterium]
MLTEKQKHRGVILAAAILAAVLGCQMSAYDRLPPRMPMAAKLGFNVYWSATVAFCIAGSLCGLLAKSMRKPDAPLFAATISEVYTDEGVRFVRSARKYFLLGALLGVIGVAIAVAEGIHDVPA